MTPTNVSNGSRRTIKIAVLAAAAIGVAISLSAAAAPEKNPEPVRMSLPEARRTVRMMDDIYKAAVVHTHQMYVQDAGTPAAVIWAKQVFKSINGKGWPAAHMLASGDRPLNPENSPSDAFDKEAIRAFQAGKPTFEKVEGNTLRYATEIRILDQKCLMCHVHNKNGDLVGGVSYRALLLPKSAHGAQ